MWDLLFCILRINIYDKGDKGDMGHAGHTIIECKHTIWEAIWWNVNIPRCHRVCFSDAICRYPYKLQHHWIIELKNLLNLCLSSASWDACQLSRKERHSRQTSICIEIWYVTFRPYVWAVVWSCDIFCAYILCLISGISTGCVCKFWRHPKTKRANFRNIPSLEVFHNFTWYPWNF